MLGQNASGKVPSNASALKINLKDSESWRSTTSEWVPQRSEGLPYLVDSHGQVAGLLNELTEDNARKMQFSPNLADMVVLRDPSLQKHSLQLIAWIASQPAYIYRLSKLPTRAEIGILESPNDKTRVGRASPNSVACTIFTPGARR